VDESAQIETQGDAKDSDPEKSFYSSRYIRQINIYSGREQI